MWRDRAITDISPIDVRAVVRAVKDRGTPYQAHNLLTIVRRLFGWAIDQQVYGVEVSPVDRLKPKVLIGEKKARQRILSPAELRALWKATQTMAYPYGPLVRLLALTGQRKSELAKAVWSEVDLKGRLLVVPPARSKTGAAHAVPLSDPAIEILNSLPRFTTGQYLFSTAFGAKPVNGFHKAKEIVDRKMTAELKSAPAPWVFHDLRRTMRTGLSAIPGISDLVRELVIGHVQRGVHKVYDVYSYETEKRAALDAWAMRLLAIVNPPDVDNVVTLHHAS